MQNRLKNIEHPGIVYKQEGNRLFVKIKPQSACASCQSKSYCGIADNTDKIIEINVTESTKYNIGDEVIVMLEQNLGYKALFLGYLVPFLILLATLIIMMFITGNEVISALTAIFLMLPYYYILYLNKHYIRKTFTFKLKKY